MVVVAGDVGRLELVALTQRGRKTLSPNAASVSPLKSSAAFAFRFATSSSVRNARPSSSFGRSNGVAELCDQTPDRSAWPSDARGGVHAFGAVFVSGAAVWAPRGITSITTAITTTSAPKN